MTNEELERYEQDCVEFMSQHAYLLTSTMATKIPWKSYQNKELYLKIARVMFQGFMELMRVAEGANNPLFILARSMRLRKTHRKPPTGGD